MLSSIAGSAFRSLLHFSETGHHLTVLTALENFGQETLKHETKQGLIVVLLLPSLLPWFFFLGTILKRRTEYMTLGAHRTAVTLKTAGMLGNVLLVHEAAAQYQPKWMREDLGPENCLRFKSQDEII